MTRRSEAGMPRGGAKPPRAGDGAERKRSDESERGVTGAPAASAREARKN
jgi:hypothetical protein